MRTLHVQRHLNRVRLAFRELGRQWLPVRVGAAFFLSPQEADVLPINQSSNTMGG